MAEHVGNLGHLDINVACRAECTLVRYYGVRAVPLLIAACGHEDSQVCYRAAWALGKIGDPAAFEALLRLTEDPDPSVQYDSAWALGKLRDPRAVGPLCRLMKSDDPNGEARYGAAQGLADLGEPAVPALLRLLEDPDLETRETAARILGGIRDERLTAPLAALPEHPHEGTRIAALEALASRVTPSGARARGGRRSS